MRWPIVTRARLERAEARHAVERARLVASREQARWMLDGVLAAMAVFGDAPTAHADPAEQDRRIHLAQQHLDEVLTATVLWRETEQGGGMAGSGYIAQRGRNLARHLFTGTDERTQP